MGKLEGEIVNTTARALSPMQTIHWKSFDAAEYCRVLPSGCRTGAAAFPEQVLICFPSKDISCKYLFVNTSYFHSYHRNITDFQLISHQKVLVLDRELPAGVSLVDAKRELCLVLQWCETWCDTVCMQNTCLFSVWTCTHVCAAVFPYVRIAVR